MVYCAVDPANPPPLTAEQEEEIRRLAAMPADEIDFSDIPELDGAGGVVDIQQGADLLAQEADELLEREVFVPLDTFFKPVDDLERRVDAHVGGDQGFLDGVQRIVIDLGFADDGPRKPLEDVAEYYD